MLKFSSVTLVIPVYSERSNKLDVQYVNRDPGQRLAN